MIASWRGLAVLAVVAIVLAGVLVVDLARPHVPPDRRLVRVDVATLAELAWDDTHVTRTGDVWKQGDVILDGGAIRDVLRTLEAATWHRRGARFAGAHHVLVAGGTKIELGDDLAGTAQTWLRVDGAVVLVDHWVAGALFPDPLALRVRQPFAAAARAEHVHVVADKVDVTLVGHPRRLGDHGPLADAGAVHALEAALADAEVVALAGGVWKGPFLVALDGASTEVGYACGSDIGLAGPYGSTCITTAAWQRIVAAAGAIGVDRRPVLAAPRKIQMPDGSEVLAGEASAAGLVHALVAPGTPVGPVAPGTKALATLIVDADVVAVFPADTVLRQLDGQALQIAHDDWLALQQPASAWADPTRWSEDPSAVIAIAIDATTYRRGAVLGEWTPAGKDLEPLAAALAHVQARDGAPTPTAHAIAVTLAPPVGPQATHTLALGVHCAGSVDGKPVVFEPATCRALEAATR